jgi:hypothetical protein
MFLIMQQYFLPRLDDLFRFQVVCIHKTPPATTDRQSRQLKNMALPMHIHRYVNKG